MPQTIKTTVEQYSISDEIQRLAPSTKRRHRRILNLVITVGGSSTPISRFTRADVDQVLALCRSRGCGPRTLNSYRSILRQFGSYLFAEGLTKRNPAVHLKDVKATTDRSKRVPLALQQVHDMAKFAAERHPRDVINVFLLAYTGARGSEIQQLKWRDIDWTNKEISFYRPKNRDWHTIPLASELAVILLDWSANPLNDGAKPTDFVVPALRQHGAGPTPEKMNPTWPLAHNRPQTKLRDVIQGLLEQVAFTGINGGTHTMRRTAAQLTYDEFGLGATSFLLGHASEQQTLAYLNLSATADRYREQLRNRAI